MSDAQLVFNSRFRFRFREQFVRAQKFLDSEVLRDCESFTPLLTGMLIKSGQLGTVIGSGRVSWIVPYARVQYFSPRKPGSLTGPLRGPFWYARAEAVHKPRWIAGVKKIAGGG